MDANFVELLRCRDGGILEETRLILDKAGVPYRFGSTETSFDITSIGTTQNVDVIVTVGRDHYQAARDAMEAEYLNADLPDDHFLLSASDHEIAEILGKPEEWSAFDVAHARRIARNRGVDEIEVVKQREERLERLKRGKPASKTLLFFGWMFSLVGGFIGLGIAWSICYMKERVPEGEFFTHDEKSREKGKLMMVVACIMIALGTILRFTIVLQ